MIKTLNFNTPSKTRVHYTFVIQWIPLTPILGHLFNTMLQQHQFLQNRVFPPGSLVSPWLNSVILNFCDQRLDGPYESYLLCLWFPGKAKFHSKTYFFLKVNSILVFLFLFSFSFFLFYWGQLLPFLCFRLGLQPAVRAEGSAKSF